ncbi:MAG: chemotaxis protein CheA [bacterium]|nr:chemotaxis protein CheA [bacterium]
MSGTNKVDKLKEIFKSEVDELIEDSEEVLVALETDVENEELINEIFRIFHSIKGSAGVVGFDDMAHFSHGVENILDRVRQGELKVSKNLISLVLESIDILKNYIEFYFGGPPVNKAKIDKIESSLNRFKGVAEEPDFEIKTKKEPKKVKKAKFFGIHIQLEEDIFLRGQDPLLLLQELHDLGEFDSIRANISKIPDLETLDPHHNSISYDVVLKTRNSYEDVKDVFIFVMDDSNKISINDISNRFVDDVDTELADKKIGEILVDEGILNEEDVEKIAAGHKRIGEEIVEQTNVDEAQVERVIRKKQKSQKVQIASTIRVKTDKLDKLINLIGEMVISVSRITMIAQETGIKEIINSTSELNRISRDLQEQIMTVRMVPLESTFKRFYRVVRDLSNSQRKSIELHISGEDTELDKTMIEQLADPLKHMVRNSVDHGIEGAADRKKAKKAEKGNIWLRAYQEEGNVVIEIEDDGKGVHPDKIYEKAVSKGVIKKSRDSFTDEEIFSFLFLPGFSTAAKVTEISGRGVGMDVVKRNIESLKGKIEVSSKPGKGSKFKIKIPLTIAIIDGMRLRIGTRSYIIPLDAIVESFQLSALDLKSVKGAKDLVNLRGEVFPLVKLHSHFGDEEIKQEDFHKGIVVLVESTFKKFCIYVDEILGISQAVIKNLQKNYRSIPGIIGASLNGDGTISLIMDIPGIERLVEA